MVSAVSHSAVLPADSSRAVLEVVSYGRAFTETLSARMGSMVEEVLSEISKQSAESGQALRCGHQSSRQACLYQSCLCQYAIKM